MGTTNHGTQEITYEYFEDATAEDFNKRHLDIQPRGIYKGGYLTRVSDSEITLSTFTAEIGDANEQISVKTSVGATITTALLDSGNLNSGTPYIVLRWAFVEAANNYIEIHAIASVAAAQTNDIIVGKVVFAGAVITGFDYTDRTFLNIQDLFFKVETSSGLYVQLRAGRIQDGSQYIIVPEEKVGPFGVPGAPNSRIDLVHIDTDGTVKIKQGSQAVSPTAPDYESKLVVAEVRVVNGDASIPADRITDVRSFITSPRSTQAEQVKASNQLTSTTGYQDVANMSINLTTKGGIVIIDFTTTVASEDARRATLSLNVDGANVTTTQTQQDNTGQSYDIDSIHMHWTILNLAAGPHIFKVRWKATNTVYMNRFSSSDRVLAVLEL